jgi:hypothetical protein
MIDHAGWHPLAPKLRASVRAPEEICQLSVLPVLARRSIAILDEIDRCNVSETILGGLIKKREWKITICI